MTSKLKKIAAVLLTLCMMFTLAACSGDAEDESSDSSYIDEEALKPIKVGFIYHSSADNKGVTGQFNDERLQAASRAGSRIETCYIENVSVTDFESAVKALISEGCSVIVSTSSVFKNILAAVSGRYMNVNFISYGAVDGKANVSPYTENLYQGTYVAGAVAAYNSKTRKIGMVVDTDLMYNYALVNAAALGMQLVYKEAEMVIVNSTTDKEIEKGVNALKNYGCDVIISNTESPHTADYCQKLGINFIGNINYSVNHEDYPNMLMFYYPKRDSYLLSKFKTLIYDEWEGQPYTGAMRNGIVNVSEALPACINGAKGRENTQKIIDKLAPLLTTDTAYIFSGELKDMYDTIKYMQNDTMSQLQIYNMEWYVKGVKYLDNFREAQEADSRTDFEIKK